MPRKEISARADELRAARIPFVHARVVLAAAADVVEARRRGDRAERRHDRGIRRRHVRGSDRAQSVLLALLDSGESLLLRITPEPEAEQPGKLVVHNPCLSGGTLELFLQPAVPSPLVLVAGTAPIALALLSIGERLGYEVRPIDDGVPTDAAAVVIPRRMAVTRKSRLAAALSAGVPYVGLVASRKRERPSWRRSTSTTRARRGVRTPAGLDIGARTPEEVALDPGRDRRVTAAAVRASGVGGQHTRHRVGHRPGVRHDRRRVRRLAAPRPRRCAASGSAGADACGRSPPIPAPYLRS